MGSRLRVYKLRVDSTVIDGSTGLGYQYENIDKYSSSGGLVNVNNVTGTHYDEITGLDTHSQFKLKIDDQIWDIPQHYSGERIFWYRWKIDKYDTDSSDFGSLISTSYQTDAASSSWILTNAFSYKCYPYVQSNDKDYGIQIYNDGDEIMIDGEYNNHIVIDGGSVNLDYSSGWWTGKEPDAAGSSGHGLGSEGTVTFSSTLSQAPLIAIRPHPVREVTNGTGAYTDEEYNDCSKGCPHDMRGLFIFGKLVGNLEDGFTGFTYLRTYTHKYHGIRFEWKALVPATAASGEDYGFQVFNSVQSVPVFDSGHDYMNIVTALTIPQSGWNAIDYVTTAGSATALLYDPDNNYHGCISYSIIANPSWTVSVEDAYYIVNEAYHWDFYSYESGGGAYNAHTIRMGIMVQNTSTNWYVRVCGAVMTTTRGLSIFAGWAEPTLPSGDYARILPVCLLR